ncbi:protein required for normal CLN1 and CLN2 G1 cyclin expression [Elasticomyces elasticus]|nr:protein required for normal CLN1 and CLN2 G1 cyclin expression [Elasticomyces elasticus]KAK3638143.1 protein required for normal CLN1 and CLN2 G1 cyclin expression [Elasticomyces elasticus]KAK4924638.1 protein required for normal CLN1 and CLN2 G1 cyclin expression [Elasticomyces elasticus]KAK5763013.1 protein required for normal CLN1 and CLN2 G1 cyclin expression [Elasticomyces elasticus]
MATTNGHTNGHPPNTTASMSSSYTRFSDIPPTIDIPVRGEDTEANEAVNLDLTELMDETDELCDLLENENAAKTYWVTIALAYAKQNKIDIAIDILKKGLSALSKAGDGGQRGREDRLSVLAAICWLYLLKCRRAPRVKPTQPLPEGQQEEKTKDHWLHAATSTLNEASRINPSYPPLFLARGTLYLLRSSLQPSKPLSSSGPDHSERTETLKQAAKCFDDAYKQSSQKNLLAQLGKAKVLFSLTKYTESLAIYQQVLLLAPDLLDPDPRIGIGCCYWALNHKTLARQAWQRSLDLNSEKNIAANILLALSYLDESSAHATTSKEFADLYKKAMTQHTQTAFKTSSHHALTCATFGSYFLLRKAWPNVERLARRAIEMTDVNAVASDGWYLLARKEHYAADSADGTGDWGKAAEYYGKADLARGGEERGMVAAKFGGAQVKCRQGDRDGGRFRLEKLVAGGAGGVGGAVGGQQQKSLEALTLLGVLYAEEVFANQIAGGKEDKSVEVKKAVGLLEQVRVSWKDPKRKVSPDPAVLLNLARLYERDAPERALACLTEVEKLELADISEDDERLPDEIGDAEEEKRARRELLSPQLLNNLGALRYEGGKFSEAREDFQIALSACVKMGERDEGVDTDGLVTSISFNLARTYEAEGLGEEAQKIYEGLLGRHPEYVDARARLAFMALQSPDSGIAKKGGEALKSLLDAEPGNLDVRALWAWHLGRVKKRTGNLNEDVEQRVYKETLQRYDKHDRYALVGMGNLHLAVAREMRGGGTDQEKERRSKTYVRAVEFFDKVLALDGTDAWAAQGMGIAVVEDKKDTSAAVQVFSKVRESLTAKSGSGGGGGSGVGAGAVYLNLGHVFGEMRQWKKAVENYEKAVTASAHERRDGRPDPVVLGCLGRVWLMRGRQEKSLECFRTSLDLSRQALELQPENVNARFNVAFVQIQLATMLIPLPEAQKSVQDVEDAIKGLEEAIESFGEIAKGPQPPFPRNDLEARANMGKNTMKRQLGQALEKQVEYERKNASRLEEARRRREEEIRKREAERVRAEDERRKAEAEIKAKREEMDRENQEDIRRRVEEEKRREEADYTTDAETGEKRKRERRVREKRVKRKKKGGEDEGDTDGGVVGEGTDVEGGGKSARRSRATSGTEGTGTGTEGEGGGRRRKKRKLERKGQVGRGSKFKSSEMVEDSDEDDGVDGTQGNGTSVAGDDGEMAVDGGDEEEAVSRPARKKAARVLDDDEDEEEEVPMAVDGEE